MDRLYHIHATKSQAIFDELATKKATREEIHDRLAVRLDTEQIGSLCQEWNGAKGSDENVETLFNDETAIENCWGEDGIRVIRLLMESLQK